MLHYMNLISINLRALYMEWSGINLENVAFLVWINFSERDEFFLPCVYMNDFKANFFTHIYFNNRVTFLLCEILGSHGDEDVLISLQD
jgi:hypothetical protein